MRVTCAERAASPPTIPSAIGAGPRGCAPSGALVAGDGYKLVDPDGLVAEAEYDLGIIIREDPVELMDDDPRPAGPLAGRPAPASTPTAIWEWGVVERRSATG